MDRVIVKFSAEDRVLNMGLHDFLRDYNGYRVLICNVNEDEFICMEDQIRSGLKKLYERLNIVSNIGYDPSRVIGYYDMDLKVVKAVDPELDSINVDDVEFKNIMKVYTTESYEEFDEYLSGDVKDKEVMEYKREIKEKRKLPRYHRLPISKIN